MLSLNISWVVPYKILILWCPLNCFSHFLFPLLTAALFSPQTWYELKCADIALFLCLYTILFHILLKALNDLQKVLSPQVIIQCRAENRAQSSFLFVYLFLLWGTAVTNTNQSNVSNWICFLFFFFSNLALTLETRSFALQDVIAKLKQLKSHCSTGKQ